MRQYYFTFSAVNETHHIAGDVKKIKFRSGSGAVEFIAGSTHVPSSVGDSVKFGKKTERGVTVKNLYAGAQSIELTVMDDAGDDLESGAGAVEVTKVLTPLYPSESRCLHTVVTAAAVAAAGTADFAALFAAANVGMIPVSWAIRTTAAASIEGFALSPAADFAAAGALPTVQNDDAAVQTFQLWVNYYDPAL